MGEHQVVRTAAELAIDLRRQRSRVEVPEARRVGRRQPCDGSRPCDPARNDLDECALAVLAQARGFRALILGASQRSDRYTMTLLGQMSNDVERPDLPASFWWERHTMAYEQHLHAARLARSSSVRPAALAPSRYNRHQSSRLMSASR